MALTRDQILASADRPTTEVEAFGGTVLIQGVSMAGERFQAYVNAPVLRPERPDAPDLNLIETPSGATSKEKQAFRQANAFASKVLSRQFTEPTAEERGLRVLAGVFVLGVIDADGKRLYGWEDIDGLRDNSIAPWDGVALVADAILDLSGAIPLEESKSDPPG